MQHLCVCSWLLIYVCTTATNMRNGRMGKISSGRSFICQTCSVPPVKCANVQCKVCHLSNWKRKWDLGSPCSWFLFTLQQFSDPFQLFQQQSLRNSTSYWVLCRHDICPNFNISRFANKFEIYPKMHNSQHFGPWILNFTINFYSLPS